MGGFGDAVGGAVLGVGVNHISGFGLKALGVANAGAGASANFLMICRS